MIKRKLLTLSLILILSVLSIAEAGDPNEAITFWLSGSDLAYQNTNLSAWLGYRNDNTEVGVAMDWRMFAEGDNDEDLQSDFAIGPYGCFHMLIYSMCMVREHQSIRRSVCAYSICSP